MDDQEYALASERIDKLEAQVERQASQLESLADKYHTLQSQHDDLVDKLTRVVNALLVSNKH